ncbi:MAG: hypothetical protein FWD48_09935 [Oscillospiraceae bacterium]|nr:hypothetical protein [Oscillospiraceae bacterium]
MSSSKKKVLIICIIAVVVIGVGLTLFFTLTSDKSRIVGTWVDKRTYSYNNSTSISTYEFFRNGTGTSSWDSICNKTNEILDFTLSRIRWEIKNNKLIITGFSENGDSNTFVYDYILLDDLDNRLIISREVSGYGVISSTYIKQ